MKLIFTESAVFDLSRLRQYIETKNPVAAKNIANKLTATIRKIPEQPNIGLAVEELISNRDLATGNYIIRYSQTPNSIIFLRIWHGKEDR